MIGISGNSYWEIIILPRASEVEFQSQSPPSQEKALGKTLFHCRMFCANDDFPFHHNDNRKIQIIVVAVSKTFTGKNGFVRC